MAHPSNLQIAAILSSVSLAALFLFYRAGAFDADPVVAVAEQSPQQWLPDSPRRSEPRMDSPPVKTDRELLSSSKSIVIVDDKAQDSARKPAVDRNRFLAPGSKSMTIFGSGNASASDTASGTDTADRQKRQGR